MGYIIRDNNITASINSSGIASITNQKNGARQTARVSLRGRVELCRAGQGREGVIERSDEAQDQDAQRHHGQRHSLLVCFVVGPRQQQPYPMGLLRPFCRALQWLISQGFWDWLVLNVLLSYDWRFSLHQTWILFLQTSLFFLFFSLCILTY